MSTQGTIKRFTLLIQKISYGANPSFKDLQDYLEEHGFKISQRTLQRDIEQIRNEFGIEISYSRIKNCYTLGGEDGLPPASLVRFLEILGTAELLNENITIEAALNLSRLAQEAVDFLKQGPRCTLFPLQQKMNLPYYYRFYI
jgi:arginine repressor